MYGHPDVTPALIARRQAAWALNFLCRDFGTMAEKFIADDDEEWIVPGANEAWAQKHGRVVAKVRMENNIAEIELGNPLDLIRGSHQSDFNPLEFGFSPQAYNYRREPEPYFIPITLPDDIPGLLHPWQKIHREHVAHNVKVERQFE